MSRIRVVAALVTALALVPLVAFAATTGPSPRRFTVAVVPDTQYLFDYEQDRGDPEPLATSFAWLVDHAQERDIVFTAGLGDVVEHGSAAEFGTASEVYDMLDDAGMPYSVLAGNHDVSGTDTERSESTFLDVFGPERFEAQPTFGGADPTGYTRFTLHGYLGDVPPAEFEDAYHARRTDRLPVGNLDRASTEPRAVQAPHHAAQTGPCRSDSRAHRSTDSPRTALRRCQRA